jgi:hypothetical protein
MKRLFAVGLLINVLGFCLPSAPIPTPQTSVKPADWSVLPQSYKLVRDPQGTSLCCPILPHLWYDYTICWTCVPKHVSAF